MAKQIICQDCKKDLSRSIHYRPGHRLDGSHYCQMQNRWSRRPVYCRDCCESRVSDLVLRGYGAKGIERGET